MSSSVQVFPTLDLGFVRTHFPALQQDWIFMDNAGGSQILLRVLDKIRDFCLTSNVQLGASYAISQWAGDRVQKAARAVATLINAEDPREVVMGSSTTLLLRILSLCWGKSLQPGDEIIVTNCDHEANIGPWVDLQKQGIVIKIWRIRPDTLQLHLEDLTLLMGARTRLVALTHTSNILGTINPIKEIAQFVHARGALICVDGVAYAPHRLVDVQDLEVDFYVFSFYKVYGPHYAVLYGKLTLLEQMPGINHYFIEAENAIPYKFQPGNVNFELSYGLLGITEYLSELAQHHFGSETAPDLRRQLIQSFALIAEQEAQLSQRILQFLTTKNRVQMIGLTESDPAQRVPTLSFVVKGQHSETIPLKLDPHKIGIRWGDFYAKHLIEALGLAAQGGVVRISMVHYNTLEEVDRLIEALDPLL